MRFYEFEDPFINSQPPKSFIDNLCAPIHAQKLFTKGLREKNKEEISVDRIFFNPTFPDAENLLETSYKDFEEFLSSADIINSKDGIPLIIERGETDCKEAYIIEVTENFIKILSADTEGVRRALIYIEDLILKSGGRFLPIGKIERKPFIKTRISRCFFSPPSHNDNQGMKNELEDDVDYYPEAYLNRLMHDGVNGLWIGANFRDLLTSSIFPENGIDGERRLKKLKTIVDRCKKYGIGIYLFSVEPASTHRNPALQNRPDLHGGTAWGGKLRLFCSSTPEFYQYIKESLTNLFSFIPDLAGFINITLGEALSGCGSTIIFDCPRCKEKFGTHSKTLVATEKMFTAVMKEVAPNAKFISWTYAQRSWKEHIPETFYQSLEERDTSVIHMQNFEDEGEAIQLGRKRKLFDYWLSFVGPGKIMQETLEVNNKRGVETFAKLQVCSSFDFGCIPYVPAPGILYDKYSYMLNNNVSGAMMCWYTGNYPGLMNKAACELSFTPFYKSKKEFLLDLAKSYWGENYESIAKAWELFEEGYKNYPLNKAFLWFSPFVDAPASPLHLKPVDLPMASSWKYTEPAGGDRIGETLLDGHTLEEAITLVSNMQSCWDKGVETLDEIKESCYLPQTEQLAIIKAMQILIASGNNLLKFYHLRRLLGIQKGDAVEILSNMQKIVEEEIVLSQKLIPLCEKLPCIGYMSEANGFKIFKEKLLWRIGELEKCLKEEFSSVRSRIESGLPPLSFYRGEEDGAVVCKLTKDGIDNATPTYFTNKNGEKSSNTSVCAAVDDERITIRFTLKNAKDDSLAIKPEFRLFHPSAPFTLRGGNLYMPANVQFSFLDEVYENRKKAIVFESQRLSDGTLIYTLSFERKDLGMEKGETFRLAVDRIGEINEALSLDDRLYPRLILGSISPDSYAFFVE